MPPTKTGEPCVSRRTDRFGESRELRGGVFFPCQSLLAPRERVTEPLTPLSRFPLDTGARIFAVRVGRFGEDRRDRFHPDAVTRQSFSRSRTPSLDKRCAALLPASRPAIAHPIPGSRLLGAFGVVKPELSPGRLAWCCAPRAPVIGFFVTYGSLRHA